MTVKATFDGKVFIPERPLDLPAGSVADVEIIQIPGETVLMKLARIAERYPSDPNDPVDGAAEHDHYLYGTPKKNE